MLYHITIFCICLLPNPTYPLSLCLKVVFNATAILFNISNNSVTQVNLSNPLFKIKFTLSRNIFRAYDDGNLTYICIKRRKKNHIKLQFKQH